MEKIPIITTKAYSILEADRDPGGTWKVKAKLGEKIRLLEIKGTPEDILKEVSSSDRVCPFHLRVFLSNLKT